MASIPLPALAVRPPEDPSANIVRAVQLKSMLNAQQREQALLPGQIQAQQNTLEAQKQENAQRAQQIKDAQAMTAAYKSWDGKDPADLGKMVIENGGSGNARVAVEQHYLGLKKNYSDIAKADAETGSKNLEIVKQKNDMTLGAINAAESVPDEQLADHLDAAISGLTQKGFIDQQHAQVGSQLIQGLRGGQIDAKTARAQLDLYKKDLMSNSQQIEQSQKEATLAKTKAEIPGAEAEAEQKQRANFSSKLAGAQSQQDYASLWGEMPAKFARSFPAPEQWTPDSKQAILNAGMTPHEQSNVPVEKQEASQWLKENPGKSMVDYARWKAALVPSVKFNIEMNGAARSNAGGGGATANGETRTPEQLYGSFGVKSGVVRAIVEGRQTAPAGFAQKSPYWQDVMNKVYQVDPQWSEQRAQIRKAFTTGPDGRNIGALNTATVHLDQLTEAAKAMKNGTWQTGNTIYNYFAKKFGSEKITNYEYVMNALAGETASALKGNATDPEIAHVMETLGRDFSPQQAEGVAENGLHVLGAKLNTYHERYQQQNPGDTVWSPVLPSAHRVFGKYGISIGDESQSPSGTPKPGGQPQQQNNQQFHPAFTPMKQQQ